MHCSQCKQDVQTKIVNGATHCSRCDLMLLPCPHTHISIENNIYKVCVACGHVVEENQFGYDNQDQDGSEDSDDKIGGTGDYGHRPNPGEDPPWIK
jgi:hypothetical protein